jgi:beta-phosphoglucomutase-like phosphatase (HAD superfamily)
MLFSFINSLYKNPTIKQPQLLIVNLHGTLLNTPYIAWQAYSHAFKVVLGTELTWDQYKQCVGKKPEAKLDILLTEIAAYLTRNNIIITDRTRALITAAKDKKYEELFTGPAMLVPGALETLRAFAAQDIHVVISTSTPEDKAQKLLEKAGISKNEFRIFSAASDATVASHLDHIIATMGVEKSACVALEDSNIAELKDTGVFVVGINANPDMAADLIGADLKTNYLDGSLTNKLLPQPYCNSASIQTASLATYTVAVTCALAAASAAVYSSHNSTPSPRI